MTVERSTRSILWLGVVGLAVVAMAVAFTFWLVFGGQNNTGVAEQILPDETITMLRDLAEQTEESGRFAEAGDTAVREQRTIGLHCVLVEKLPLFDYFAMFTPEGDAHIKRNVQQRADEILSTLDGSETRDDLGRLVWGDDWSPDLAIRETCLTLLEWDRSQAASP